MAKAKIIATLGPASSTSTVLRKMMQAGLDMVRLNFSHGHHADHAQRISLIRELNCKYRRHIRVLQDLEGFRIRVGKFFEGKPIMLERNRILWIRQDESIGSQDTISFDYQGSLRSIHRGHRIFIDDGNIVLEVKAVYAKKLKTKVILGGALQEHKGINIPEAKLIFGEMTRKDKEDIQFGVSRSVDYIAQSFVRNKKDILSVRDQLGVSQPRVFAKIESSEGLRNLDEIIHVSDGILVARGDLGVCFPLYAVGVLQKQIIKKCIQAKKPVITATQMLESMVFNHAPTRAEVSDVTNAVLDGSTFVMLSAETAVGKHPVAAVAMMNEIIKFTEQSCLYRDR